MNEYLKRYRYYLLITLIYYLFPFFLMKDTGSAMLILLVLLPMLTIFISFSFAKNNSFKLHFSVIVFLIWIPNCYFMNSSALIYSFIYMFISLIGQSLGFFSYKRNLY